MRTIQGKKVLVTGAASGIGRAVALRLAAEGAHLYLLDVDVPRLANVVREVRQLNVEAVGVRCDLTRTKQLTETVNNMLARWQAVDILVNNAGVAFYGPTDKMTAEQWKWLLAINLYAPIQITSLLLPTLLTRPEAHVVNMASICGLVAGGRFCAYTTSKYGLVGFTEALRAEYGRQGLGVSAVCPGPVRRTNLYDTAPCGHEDKTTPSPPDWVCTTPERVASKVVRAIHRDKRLTVVSPLANFLYFTNRISPGFYDRIQRLGRRRRMKKKARLAETPPERREAA